MTHFDRCLPPISFAATMAVLASLAFTATLRAQVLDTRQVRCKSEDFKYRECRVQGSIVRARVEKQKSSAQCRLGHSFGHKGDVLWVNRGCDAEFEVTYRRRAPAGGPGAGRPPFQNPYPDNRYPGQGASFDLQRLEIECKSENFRRNRCRAPGPIERARLRDTDSDAACIQGRSWGWERDYVWVDEGCDGDFEVYVRSRRPQQGLGRDQRTRRLNCSSRNFRQENCFVEGRILDIRLLRRRSRADCREGRSYGFRRDHVWVDDGCSAEFEVLYRPDRGFASPPVGGQDRLSCRSRDYRYQTCRSDGWIRSARLLDQKSDAPCRRGESWGRRGDSIWVDKGCAGEFLIDYR